MLTNGYVEKPENLQQKLKKIKMKKDIKKRERRDKIRRRIRSSVFGTANKPRLCVYKSNKHIYTQLIDDFTASTLTAASTVQLGEKLSKKEAAGEAGKKIAEKAKEKGINNVVFDRSGYKYHGVVKALAEGAREGGLNF